MLSPEDEAGAAPATAETSLPLGPADASALAAADLAGGLNILYDDELLSTDGSYL